MTDSNQTNPIAGPVELGSPKELNRPLDSPALAVEAQQVGTKAAAIATPVPESNAKFADDAHQYVREYIRNADAKATFLFAGNGALIAFLFTRGGGGSWLRALNIGDAVDWLGLSAMAILVGAAASLFTVVFPRLGGAAQGILFFNAIAEHESSTAYAEAVARRTSSDLARIKLEHTYDLAKVCRAKYRALGIGFRLSAVGALTAVVYLVLAEAGDLGRFR
jgi:hypothetical protein